MSKWEIAFYIVIVLVYFIVEKIRIRRVEKSIHTLNTHFGAPFTPRFHRQLRPEETALVKGKSNKHIKNWHIVCLLVAGLVFTIAALDVLMWNRIVVNLVISVSVLALILQLHYKNKVYADTISPAMKLVGPLSWPLNVSPKSLESSRTPIWLKFFVGKESFKIGLVQNPKLYTRIIETLHTDDLVEIEYTAHTKTVLDVYKYNGRD